MEMGNAMENRRETVILSCKLVISYYLFAISKNVQKILPSLICAKEWPGKGEFSSTSSNTGDDAWSHDGATSGVRQASGMKNPREASAKPNPWPVHDPSLHSSSWALAGGIALWRDQEAITVVGQNAWPNRKKTLLTAQEPKPLPHWKCRTVLQPHHLQAGSCKERLFTCRKSW